MTEIHTDNKEPSHALDPLTNQDLKKRQILQNLLLKFPMFILDGPIVKNGFEQLNKISEPVIKILEDRKSKITTLLSNLIFETTVYNQLVELWLLQNMPYGEGLVSFEDFITNFGELTSKSKTDYGRIPKIFYNKAAAEWQNLKEPSVEDIKEALLKAVAKVIDEDLGSSDGTISNTLYKTFKALVEKQRELINEDLYTNTVWEVLQETHREKKIEIIEETRQYYKFAKRFVLMDFPLGLSNVKDIPKLVRNLVKDRALYYGDTTLSLVETYLDTIMDFLNIGYPGSKDANTLLEKGERLIKKGFITALTPVRSSTQRVLKLKDHKAYIKIDDYLHLTEKLDKTIYYSVWGYDVLREKLLNTPVEFVKVKIDNIRNVMTIMLKNLDIEVVRENFKKLSKKYHILKKGVVNVSRSTLMIALDRKAREQVAYIAKKEIQNLYTELKDLEREKILRVGGELYRRIINKYKEVRECVTKPQIMQDGEEPSSQVRVEEKEPSQPVKVEEKEVPQHVKVEEKEVLTEEKVEVEEKKVVQEKVEEDVVQTDVRVEEKEVEIHEKGEEDEIPAQVKGDDEEENNLGDNEINRVGGESTGSEDKEH